jgi:hypothetical protein
MSGAQLDLHKEVNITSVNLEVILQKPPPKSPYKFLQAINTGYS